MGIGAPPRTKLPPSCCDIFLNNVYYYITSVNLKMSDINEKLITHDLIFTLDINTVYQVNNISTSVVDNINKSGKKYCKE